MELSHQDPYFRACGMPWCDNSITAPFYSNGIVILRSLFQSM